MEYYSRKWKLLFCFEEDGVLDGEVDIVAVRETKKELLQYMRTKEYETYLNKTLTNLGNKTLLVEISKEEWELTEDEARVEYDSIEDIPEHSLISEDIKIYKIYNMSNNT